MSMIHIVCNCFKYGLEAAGFVGCVLSQIICRSYFTQCGSDQSQMVCYRSEEMIHNRLVIFEYEIVVRLSISEK